MENLVNKILDMDADQFETAVFDKISSNIKSEIDNTNKEE